MDLRKTRTFRTRLLRALEVVRIPQIQISGIQITTTPLIDEPKELLECSPLFPFSLRLNGELQGFYFFTSSQKKIPFSQEEVQLSLKKFFHLFIEKLENQTNLMLNLSDMRTPKYDRLPPLTKPLRDDENVFSLQQQISLSKPYGDSLEIVAFLLIGHETPSYREV